MVASLSPVLLYISLSEYTIIINDSRRMQSGKQFSIQKLKVAKEQSWCDSVFIHTASTNMGGFRTASGRLLKCCKKYLNRWFYSNTRKVHFYENFVRLQRTALRHLWKYLQRRRRCQTTLRANAHRRWKISKKIKTDKFCKKNAPCCQCNLFV